MKKWEYHRILRNSQSESAPAANVFDEMNVLGNEGWKLIHFDWSNHYTLAVMEREIPEPPTDKQIDRLAKSLSDDCRNREIPGLPIEPRKATTGEVLEHLHGSTR